MWPKTKNELKAYLEKLWVDKPALRRFWRKHAGDKALFDYRYDPQKKGYINQRGQLVSESYVEANINQLITSIKTDVLDISQNLQSKRIEKADWYEQVGEIIALAVLTVVAVGWGGFRLLESTSLPNATPEEAFANAMQHALEQLDYLKKYNDQVGQGLVSSGQIPSRTAMYAAALWGIFQGSHRIFFKQTEQYTEERRYLGNADHCSQCPEYARRGWQPIGTLPYPSEKSDCMVYCRCTMRYR